MGCIDEKLALAARPGCLSLCGRHMTLAIGDVTTDNVLAVTHISATAADASAAREAKSDCVGW